MKGEIMQTSICCTSASARGPAAVAEDTFAQMVVLDYYDGPVGGLLKCRYCNTGYHFYLLDWDNTHAVRIFALAPTPESTFARIFELFGAIPDRRIWFPPWPREEDLLDLLESDIQDVANRADTPTLVIAWSNRTDRTLAMRGLDSSLKGQLRLWFDLPSHADLFDWFNYLGLPRQ